MCINVNGQLLFIDEVGSGFSFQVHILCRFIMNIYPAKLGILGPTNTKPTFEVIIIRVHLYSTYVLYFFRFYKHTYILHIGGHT